MKMKVRVGSVQILALAHPPLQAERNKESRTVGGTEPSLSSVPFFYSLRYLSALLKEENQQTWQRMCSFSGASVICSVPTERFVPFTSHTVAQCPSVPARLVDCSFLEMVLS